MLPRHSFHWAWRVPLALAGSIAATVELACFVGWHAPATPPLERLYAGLLGGMAVGQILLLATLMAPSMRHLLARLAILLVALTLLLIGAEG